MGGEGATPRLGQQDRQPLATLQVGVGSLSPPVPRTQESFAEQSKLRIPKSYAGGARGRVGFLGPD